MTIRFGTDGWRGIIGDDFTAENVRRVARAYADYLHNKGGIVYLGFDRRFRSADFARIAAETLAAQGLTVRFSKKFAPTPAISWQVRRNRAAGGVVITASHNPAIWNGIKIKEPTGAAASAATTAAIEKYLENPSPPHPRWEGRDEGWQTFDPTHGYLDALRKFVSLKAIAKARLKIVYDPMYGAGSGYLTPILGKTVTEIHGEENPLFGGLHPEPIEPHLGELKRTVRRGHFSFGLATDGDADRLGAVDDRGRFVDAHQIYALLVQHLVEARNLKGRIIKTVTTTHMIDRLAARYGFDLIETPVGFKHISGLLAENGTLIGGEESGGIGIAQHLPERDGLLNALLIAEIVALAGEPLSKIVARLQKMIGPLYYRRVDLKMSCPQIEQLMNRLGSNGLARIGSHRVRHIDTKDGFKIYCEGDAWLLIRPSGTEPLLRTYAEAPSLKEVNQLLSTAHQLV